MENHYFSWVNPLFLWPYSSSETVNVFQRVSFIHHIFPINHHSFHIFLYIYHIYIYIITIKTHQPSQFTRVGQMFRCFFLVDLRRFSSLANALFPQHTVLTHRLSVKNPHHASYSKSRPHLGAGMVHLVPLLGALLVNCGAPNVMWTLVNKNPMNTSSL